jgi:hypothetical protein
MFNVILSWKMPKQNIEWTGILQHTCVKHIGLSPHVALGSMKIAFIREQYLPKFLTIS